MTIRDIRKLPKDLDMKISKDFNALIRKFHTQLSTKKRSPVYTGFFASSWVAQGTPVKATDKVENFKIIPVAYDVEISSKLLSEFTNKQYNLKYFIALEPDSTFG